MTVADAVHLAPEAKQELAQANATAWDCLLAALPPLLLGLALSAFLLGHVPLSRVALGGKTPYLVNEPSFRPLIAPGLISLLLIAGGLWGGRRRLPRWSYTWATGSVVVVLLSLALVGEFLPYLLSPALDVALILGLLLVLAAVAFIAAWRDALDAYLVGLGFASTFAVAITFGPTAGPFSRVDVGLLSVPVGLLCAALIAAYLRGDRTGRQAVVACTGVLNAALIWTYRTIILSAMPHFSDGSFHWKLLAVAISGLLGPPLLSGFLGWRRPGGAG